MLQESVYACLVVFFPSGFPLGTAGFERGCSVTRTAHAGAMPWWLTPSQEPKCSMGDDDIKDIPNSLFLFLL